MEELRRLRRTRGWTQQQLAHEAGLTQHTISEIETGKQKPYPSTLRKLAIALEVGIPELFKGDETPKAPALGDPEVERWLEAHGFEYALMPDQDFSERVLNLGSGKRGLEAVWGLMREINSEGAQARKQLSREWSSGDGLRPPELSRSSDVWFSGMNRLKRDVAKVYSRKQVALMNYAETLEAERDSMPARADREQALEEALALA